MSILKTRVIQFGPFVAEHVKRIVNNVLAYVSQHQIVKELIYLF